MWEGRSLRKICKGGGLEKRMNKEYNKIGIEIDIMFIIMIFLIDAED